MLKLKKKKKRKIFLKEDLSATDFFAALHESDIRYVLLRWWKAFPVIEEGEDLDLLVHRDDYSRLERWLSTKETGLRCDVYYHIGIGGNRKTKLPYFPPKLASDTLEHRALHQSLVYVPSPEHYFATLAFHALFHKGIAGGIPGFIQTGKAVPPREHDYVAELTQAASDCKVDVAIEAHALSSWLEQKGYAPPLDMLSKLADKHAELVELADLPSLEDVRLKGELFVLVLRELGGKSPAFVERVRSLLRRRRMEILGEFPLSPEQVRRASGLRGNNWGKGPYKMSGGKPHTLIVGYDWYPRPPQGMTEHSLLQNTNLPALKDEARGIFNARRWRRRHCNVVHSADNEAEALQYLLYIDTSIQRAMRAKSLERKARFAPAHPIIETLSEGRRARTDLISFDGKKAVKKTYKTGFDTLLSREIEARRLFAKDVPMPEILDHGEGYVIMEYLADVQYLDLAQLSEDQKRRFAKIFVGWARAFWQRGYFQADFSPKNILVSADGRLSFIDFEFLQPYENERPDFPQAYEFTGIPESELEHFDRPVSREQKCMIHKNWRELPFDDFIAPLLAPEKSA